jgi:hypothetical protein
LSEPTHAHPLTHPGSGYASASATRALRLVVGLALALSLLLAPQAADPAPVAAGSSCTGWTSQTNPPRTIRVLRTRTGAVETVDFRRYVARVMASGEWPSRLKMATLEAGAVATKQYAWYYTMRGNHRSWYVRGGRCYDVRDDTNDQLYKHYASPTSRQWKAVDKTWGLTLRKNGNFFLTGYRAGIISRCAADANGWKLYARSMQACAHQGWSYLRILRKYLNPNLALVWSDAVGPVVSRPKVRLKVGNSVDTGAATVSWQPLPRTAEVAGYMLQRKVGDGAWKDISLPTPKAWKTDAWVKVDGRTRFRIKAQDPRGNWGPWSYSARRRAAVRGPVGTTIAGDVGTATIQPQKVRVRFTGRSVALVTRTGPGMGRVKVFLNGRRVAIVDLERPNPTHRKLVWAKNWSKTGTHAVAVKPVDSIERVDFNGFFTLR